MDTKWKFFINRTAAVAPQWLMIAQKIKRLKSFFYENKPALIAFSGGVDSSLLAKIAYDTVGEQAIAITASGPTFAKLETENARSIAREIGIQWMELPFDPMQNPLFNNNSPNRCFYCKKELYTYLRLFAAKTWDSAILVDGTNAEDDVDERPGYKALVELGISKPLRELGFTKQDITNTCREVGLSNWDKPSQTCTATRIPYGTRIDISRIKRIERCEAWIKKNGFTQFRLRDIFPEALVELCPTEFSKKLTVELRQYILEMLKSEGYIAARFEQTDH
ncbi:MAG: ATP-dependent sacrificial sulfur transferase LarE [Pseudomonadota bacterium]